MPVEAGRTTARKKITLPGDREVYIPVITQLKVIDPADRYQESWITVENSHIADGRDVRVDRVYAVDANGQVTNQSQYIEVERILKWRARDAADRHWETQSTLDNTTGAETRPPHFTTHVRTHVVRYYDPDDDSVWVDSELIDELIVIDATDRYQETHYVLTHNDAQADPNDPDITDSEGVDPPYRTDPWQNIVNFSPGVRLFVSLSASVHEDPFNDTPPNIGVLTTAGPGIPSYAESAQIYGYALLMKVADDGSMFPVVNANVYGFMYGAWTGMPTRSQFFTIAPSGYSGALFISSPSEGTVSQVGLFHSDTWAIPTSGPPTPVPGDPNYVDYDWGNVEFAPTGWVYMGGTTGTVPPAPVTVPTPGYQFFTELVGTTWAFEAGSITRADQLSVMGAFFRCAGPPGFTLPGA